MRLPTVMAALGLASSTMAQAKISLVHPPQFGGRISPSQRDAWMEGQTIDIEWTEPEPNRLLSVVLYQMTATMAANYNGNFPSDDPPFEFITHDQVNQTKFRWIVATTKDLSISNQFAIAVWVGGMVVTDSATNIFNITRRPATVTVTVTKSSGSPTATITGMRLYPEESPSSGLSAGASAGIGIGAALGVMALAAVGWILVRRKRQRAIPVNVGGSPQSPGPESPMTPEKMGYFQYPPTTRAVNPSEVGLSPVRAEMPPESTDRYELATGK